MAAKTTTRVVSDKVEHYTIWDNFNRHVEELKALGAVDSDLIPLQQAAESVSVIEQQEAVDSGKNPSLNGRTLADLTQPHTCANGWVIAPPSPMARRYAIVAGLRLTNGGEPNDMLAMAAFVAFSLWCLKAWGDGRKDQVMQVVYGSGTMAELLPGLLDQCDVSKLDALIADYAILMGLATTQKKTAAMQDYEAIRLGIQTRLLPRSTEKF